MNARLEDLYPLAPAQEGMLFHSLADGDGDVYVNRLALLLEGPLEPADLRAAWHRLSERHPVLRTSFFWDDAERPLQVVHRRVELPWEELDWSAAPEDWRTRADQLFATPAWRRFELDRPPLQRFALARLGPHRHVLLWSHHHALLDGWSLAVLVRELFVVLAAQRDGGRPHLPPARPFADFVAWLETRDAADDEVFWRRRLAGAEVPTPLPGDGGDGSDAPAAAEARRPLAATARLAEGARRHRVTPSTLVQAAWALALCRRGGCREAVFGVTVSGRPPGLPGIESTAGLFINTLPARVAVDPRAPLGPWLAALQAAQGEMADHEQTPLARIQAWTGTGPRRPLFESAVVFENFPSAAGTAQADGLAIAAVHAHESTHYPLVLQTGPGDPMVLRLHHDPRRLSRAGAARLLAQVEALLDELAAAPGDLPLARLGGLSPAESAQVLAWNATGRDYDLGGGLHERIAATAREAGERVAVRCGEATLSYRELDDRAGRLAAHLAALGVGRGDRVGIAVERSLELIVALLGTLRAGAAYVPFDPDYPPRRLDYLLADSAVGVLLTGGAGAALAPAAAGRGVRVVPLAESWGEIAARPPRPPVAVDPDDLAYVIYTSGSTGRPKGAMLPHRGIVNRLLWMQEAFALGPDDRVLQKTPVGFDVSVWELFWPLLVGAELVFAPPGAHRDPAHLVDLVRRHGVTTLHFVPSMLQAFLAEPGVEACTSLGRVVASGEALPPALVGRFFERIPGCRLDNLYGPTEASVDVTAWPCSPDDAHRGVPIGRPVANTTLHVVDADFAPVPVGVPGELCLGGVQLARGYLGRPALTAERFVPDPRGGRAPGSAPGDRLYRTGDLARWRPDGAVDFLGRLDHQVKLRGQRIELGEIETVLGRHPAVRECVVLLDAHDDPPRLVAYLVPHGAAPAPDELRRHLAADLPEAMVPARFVALDRMPLSPNGKLDRAALPRPGGERPDLDRPYAAPTNPAEEILADVWREVLGVDRVGLDDDFFALGGDSILSLRVVGALRRRGRSVTVADLFAHRTLRAAAAVLRSAEDDPEALLSRLDELSDDEVAALLEDMNDARSTAL